MGIGKLLVVRGHNVSFIHYLEHKDLTERHGIKFISLLDHKGVAEIPTDNNDHEELMKGMFENLVRTTPLEMARSRGSQGGRGHGFGGRGHDHGRGRGRGGRGRGRGRGGKGFEAMAVGENEAIVNAIKVLKPDIVMGDYRWVMPFMGDCPVPFIPIMSNAPLSLYNGPPLGSGISIFDPPEKLAEARLLMKHFGPPIELDKKNLKPWNFAEYLGIYIYPKPLDYIELGSPAKNWVRLDQSIRMPDPEDFEIPDKLKDKPGKLIYLSMGTNASNSSKLIQLLVDACSKSPHRFIVATGKYGDEVILPDNVWGDKFVKQINILPKVDLVITHCGSNSLIETLYFGKPILAIPQFDDQLDNGQRVADLKLGKVINMWEFAEKKFCDSIEEILNDTEISERVSKISKEIGQSSSADKIIEYIEFVAKNKKSPFDD